jgi:hypothetical protein
MKKVGGDDPHLYLLPCLPPGSGASEPKVCPPVLGVFEADDSHGWSLRWATTTPPQAGEARLRVVVPSVEDTATLAESRVDQILAAMYTLARGAGVEIDSTQVEPLGVENGELIEYDTQELNISLSSVSHGDVFTFLSALLRKMPYLEVSDFSMSGFSGEPAAKVSLRFLLSPKPKPEEE